MSRQYRNWISIELALVYLTSETVPTLSLPNCITTLACVKEILPHHFFLQQSSPILA